MAKRVLAIILGVFFLVLLLCTYLPIKTVYGAGLVILAAVLPVALIPYRRRKLAVACLISCLSALLLYCAANYNVNRWSSALTGETAAVSGQVVDYGTNAAGTLQRYQIRLDRVNGTKLPFYSRFHIYVYTDSDTVYIPGTSFDGTLEFFDTAVDYGFGREDQVFLSAFLQAPASSFAAAQEPGLVYYLYQFRMTVQGRIAFGNEKTNGLLQSVCFGDTNRLDSGLYVSLRRIGLSHVTAVSGLHLTFAVLFFNYLFILLGIQYRVRYILDIFISIFFTALVGFPFSCVRACIMLVIYYLGLALNLMSDGLTSLSAAAFLIVLVNPFAVRDVGFLLSASATFGILVLRAPIEGFLFPPKLCKHHRVNGIYRQLTGAFACSAAATVATLPIVILSFGSLSLIGPLANLILIFPLQWIFMMGIMMVLFGWIPGVGAALGWLCDLLYQLVDVIGDFLGRLPFASVSGFSTTGLMVLALLAVILAAGLYDFFRHQRRSFMALLLLLLCFTGCFHIVYVVNHPGEQVEIAFVDVGFGDCTVISKDHTAVILDYGGSSEKRYNLVDYLRKRNIYTVELLAFTHLHADHTNGLRTLLRNFYVDQILYPDLEFDSPEIRTLIQSQNFSIIQEEQTITVLEDVRLEVLAEAVLDETLAEENERCVCYRITYGDTSVLVTGDLEGEAELKLSDRELDCTLLKVAHHGSDTSSFYPFIKAAAPEAAVISVGENSYGLPDSSVIERLKTVCPLVLQTQEEGTIVFRTDGTTMERILK